VATRRSGESAEIAREHHEGNDHGDVERLRSGEVLRGVGSVAGNASDGVFGPGRARRNAANLRIGSRVQQTCESTAEKPGEVVRNHTVGTGRTARNRRARSEGGDTFAGVDAEDDVDGGAADETQERKVGN
jgi:hypothetical protein